MMAPLREWRASLSKQQIARKQLAGAPVLCDEIEKTIAAQDSLRERITGNRGPKTTGGWMKFHIGDEVWDVADPRHVGRLDKIVNSSRCTVTWTETGWKSTDVNLADLRKYDRRGNVVQQYPEEK